ncbi:hypothetical protein JG688_00017141 [Phytophthora aleatoria]|uniref:Uncharacterized protein n=1 Tax=Phytophthora aleatoria TaxID=2496075 RepID=A0A8J5IT05_9STRA|nr:hypothetical protein JG688_00017141 [Phytophthora aleatoria]
MPSLSASELPWEVLHAENISSMPPLVTSSEIGVVPASATSCEWIAVGGGPLAARRAPGGAPSAGGDIAGGGLVRM